MQRGINPREQHPTWSSYKSHVVLMFRRLKKIDTKQYGGATKLDVSIVLVQLQPFVTLQLVVFLETNLKLSRAPGVPYSFNNPQQSLVHYP